jgi:hypothetical protein
LSNAPQLSERTRSLVLAEIKAHIAAELAAVRSDRADAVVNTDPPRSFFIFDGAHTYQCPAVFCVVDSFELPEERTGANHVNAVVKMYVSVVIEDKDATLLTIKSERYQAALFKILHWTTMTDTKDNVKLWSRVVRCAFSPVYTKNNSSTNQDQFRKEVSLELEVKHFENPTI